MYMPNAKPNARRPNATYIPLTGVGGWRRVKRNFLVSRRVKREKFSYALGNAKVLFFALGDTKVPNANYFASQWNIGFRFFWVPKNGKMLGKFVNIIFKIT